MIILAFLFTVLIVVIDQLVKMWVINNMTLGESREFIVIEGERFMNLTFCENTGAIFSAFEGMRIMLIILPSLLVIASIAAIIFRMFKKPVPVFAIAAIAGGGIGNLIDRVFRGGAVVDFFDMQLFDFAVFNVADCFITVGAFVLAIYVIFFDKEFLHGKEAVDSEESDDISVVSVSMESAVDHEKNDDKPVHRVICNEIDGDEPNGL